MISASEIASWAWCPESWRLDALGCEPGNRDAMSRGTAHHKEKAAFEGLSRLMMTVGLWLIVLAALAFLVVFLPRGA